MIEPLFAPAMRVIVAAFKLSVWLTIAAIRLSGIVIGYLGPYIIAAVGILWFTAADAIRARRARKRGDEPDVKTDETSGPDER